MTRRYQPQHQKPRLCSACGKDTAGILQRTPCLRLVCPACYAVITAPTPEPAAKPARKARAAK
ncbi:MAG: hypothetical protein EBR82_48430 [Caulobacteraceae bacterium]|nr:hypothetical protein [Caulobacteraceae bacterium]